MKKLITTVAAASFAASVFAQGYVNLSNGSTTDVSTNGSVNYLGQTVNAGGTGLTVGSSPVTGVPNAYYYALFAQSYSGSGPTAANGITTLGSEGWLFTGLYATNSLGAGRFNGGTDTATTQNK
jgi:hypothetical protein